MSIANYSKMQLSPKGKKYQSRIRNPFLFNIFLVIKLPLAWAAGTRLKKIDATGCQISMPYGWRNQNPFKSIYFAAQAMSAEMSTGMLAVFAIENSEESIAMLVSDVEGSFSKKADAHTTFTCNDGQKMFDAIAETCKTGEPVLVKMNTIGTMRDGTEVSNFTFTWSVKKRSR